ncbi:MAG: DUF996 domain-containing protein [Thaumarchaeota archaeon]|jgi:uncharacterized membrane protein|nr:DUF996 domain-containing protein [Nitrososphaerota archaeon]
MSELKDAKLYGGIGSILSSFGSFVPFIGSLLSIAGFVLEILAVNKISHVVNDKDIFKNYVAALIVGVVGVVVAVIFGFIVAFLLSIPIPERVFTGGMLLERGLNLPLVGAAVLVLIVIWITLVIAMSFMKKSFESIAVKLNVPMFKTVATLYWIGALATIVVVGLLILFVGNVLKIVAYFSIPEEVRPLPPPPPPPPPKS